MAMIKSFLEERKWLVMIIIESTPAEQQNDPKALRILGDDDECLKRLKRLGSDRNSSIGFEFGFGKRTTAKDDPKGMRVANRAVHGNTTVDKRRVETT